LVPGSATKSQRSAQLEFESHRIYYGHIVNPDNERLLDEVLVSAMKAPRTYTREDVVEINAHGGGSGAACDIKAGFEKRCPYC
jgi:tRNA modification GTPase